MADPLNGVGIEERAGRYRVTRSFPSGRFATVGIFGTVAQAVAFATELVESLDDEILDTTSPI